MGFQIPNIIITLAGFMVAISVLILFINLYRSARFGKVAVGNVWQSRSPEWQIPSPTPQHNYPVPLRVVGEPYDYAGGSEQYVELDGAAPAAHAAD
jgi:cytochrome c oxidase subunit 1